MNININLEQIKQSFNEKTLARGIKYYNDKRVQSITFDAAEGQYSGRVVGHGKHIYSTILFVKDNAMTTVCSCPVGFQCKHGVATALAILKPEKEIDSIPAEAPILPTLSPAPHKTQSHLPAKPKVMPIVKSGFDSWLEKTEKEVDLLGTKEELPDNFLHYIVTIKSDCLCVEFRQPKRLKNGLLSQGRRISLSKMQQISYAYHHSDYHISDVAIAKKIKNKYYYSSTYDYEIDESAKCSVLLQMIETGRCHWQDIHSAPITLSNKHSLNFAWTDKEPYRLLLLIDDKPLTHLLDTRPLAYINSAKREAGYIDTTLQYRFVERLKALPALLEKDLMQFVIWATGQGLNIPLPKKMKINVIDGEFQPVLTIDHDGHAFFAQYHFSYGEFTCAYGQYPWQASLLLEVDGQLVRLERDLEKEQQALDLLFKTARFEVASELINDKLQPIFRQPEAFFWASFNETLHLDLVAQGWIVDIKSTQPFPKVIDLQGMQAEVQSGEYDDWFQLGLSIDINNKKVDLVPLLLGALAQVDDWHALPDSLYFPYQGDYLTIDKQQLQPIIKILQQLTDDKGRIPRFHAGVLNDIPFINEWTGDQKIRQLADKLARFEGLESVSPPLNLNAQLREYQEQGVNWLNFLQEYGFGGILADDMGLGKTIQALAMMQLLFERKQLSKPILVVCPTSLVGNWRNEAAKFTPDLKVLVLHGTKRKTLFDNIDDHHLIITTYPLVHRDFEALSQLRFQWLILDEAQVIKNPKAKMTQSVKQLKAEHKLCLTGTPMENHLGELWSLFDFLMPGYLSNNKGFNDLYRKPIESGEGYAQEWLNKRISPFLLRRTKDQVATELPAKTEIIQSLALPKEQRTLYESIRVTMEKKVRDLLKEKGIAKSQIEFLDALLKLRQACCHPNLVKLDAAKKVNSSAKLEFLLSALPEMLEEGRKVLIFSQFTQMLKIIETALHEINIKTTKLTGQTRNREEAIDQFTSGKVDVFLISLKAGGVGLNLTEADTVIHFDPWWNPAAENQATDRAYRIGQDKPVFVYKLVTENTIEERVLALQKNKQAMADSVYGSQAQKKQAALTTMDAGQLLSLFE